MATLSGIGGILEVAMAELEFREALTGGWTQVFAVERVLAEAESAFQKIIVFENPFYGRVLALDGIIQSTSKDEFIYHEALTHIPLFAHGRAKRVLIIGGGDGGTLREVLRHPSVERAVMVEIDGDVVDLCREFLPAHSAGAFDDPRTELIIGDGLAYVRDATHPFDVILCDSTDPVGPGQVLFTSRFYGDCKRCLAPGGVFVNQNGTVFDQYEGLRNTRDRLGPHVRDFTFFTACVPTYIGGVMAFAWASDDETLRQVPLATLESRYAASGIACRYYAPAAHLGAFGLPKFIADAV